MTTEEQTKPAELKPPGTLHEMLGMAIEDFRKILKDPMYRVSMDTWYNFVRGDGEPDICYVCLAGAVVSQRMKPEGTRIDWDLVSNEWALAFEALNCIRQGDVVNALYHYYSRFSSPGAESSEAAAASLLTKIKATDSHPLDESDVRFDSADPEPFLKYLDEVHSLLKAEGV